MGKSDPKTERAKALDVHNVSWVDRFTLWIDQLPWPVWAFYIGLLFISQLLLNIVFWIDGSVPLWKNVTIPSVSFPLIISSVAFFHSLIIIGTKALQNFRPLLEADDDEIAKIDTALNYVPSSTNWIVLIVSIAGSLSYVNGGSITFGPIIPRTNLPIISVYILSILTVMPFFNLLIRMFRQIRILGDLHGRASNINLLHLAPAHSFARLTASTGGGLIILMVMGTLYNPQIGTGVNLAGLILSILFGILIFFAPLIGMRNRLVNEKVQRLKEISELLQLTMEQIHGKARNQNKIDLPEAKTTMSALIEEKALIEKVSTWPWDTGTIRGFTSTLVLPILLWFITNYLGRLF